MPEHLDEAMALLWLEGELDPRTSARWRQHAGACPRCHRLTQALRNETRWLRQGLGAASEPAPASHWALWAALAGIGSAVLGVFAFWLLLLRPWMQGLDQMGVNGQSLMNTVMFSAMFWRGWASLNHVLEILGPVAFFASAWLLLRPQRGHHRRLAMMVLLLGLGASFTAPRLLAAPMPALARKTRQKTKKLPAPAAQPALKTIHLPIYIKTRTPFILPAGEAVSHDLVIWAPQVRIDGQVQGNLICWTQSLTVDGQVQGDLAVWAQNLHINPGARVGRDVFSFLQNVNISGLVQGSFYDWSQHNTISSQVNGSAFFWSQNMTMEPQAQVGGDVVGLGQFMNLQGRIGHNVLARFQNQDISGQILGSVRLFGESLNIGPTARLARGVYFKGKRPPHVSRQAQLSRPVDFVHSTHTSPWKQASFYWHQGLWWATGLLFGLVFLALFPNFFVSVERLTARVGLSLGIGIVALVATPIIVILAGITIIGLPLSLVLLFLYLIGLFLAEIIIGNWLGLSLLGPAGPYWRQALRLALGLFIVRIAVNLPWVGAWILCAIMIWGLGLQAIALYQFLRRPAVMV